MPELELATASYYSIHKEGADGWLPVRSSVGAPRFIRDSRTWPFASKTAPYGLMKIDDRDQFADAYFARLDGIGYDVIMSQLQGLAQKSDNPRLVLCCFEKLPDILAGKAWCHRHLWRDWMEAHGHPPIPELRHDGRVPRAGIEPAAMQLPIR